MLHPEVVALVERFDQAGVPTYDRLGVEQARAQLDGVVRLQQRPPELARVEDVVAGGAPEPVPVRVYSPTDDAADTVVVYLHGGGFVLGTLDAADEPCRALAVASGATVVSVDYRLAPETRFPGALDDAVAATRWAAGRARRVVVLGDSAGGALAAGVSAAARDDDGLQVDAQVLVYPTLAPPATTDTASMRANAAGPLMTRAELDWFWSHYLGEDVDPTDPRAAPLHDIDLGGHPDTTVVVAQYDPLRDEGLMYASRLAAAGADVRTVEFLGAPHGFWWMDRELSQARDLTALLADVVRGRVDLPASSTR